MHDRWPEGTRLRLRKLHADHVGKRGGDLPKVDLARLAPGDALSRNQENRTVAGPRGPQPAHALVRAGAERRPMIFGGGHIILWRVEGSHPISQRGCFRFHFSYWHFPRYAMLAAILHVLAEALGSGAIRGANQTVFHFHARSLEQHVRAHHIVLIFESVSRDQRDDHARWNSGKYSTDQFVIVVES